MKTIDIIKTKIDAEALVESVSTLEDGGVVLFLGRARRHSDGREVLKLAYEAYYPMAIRELEKVVERARDKFQISNIGIIHRIGEVPLGEAAVAVVAASPHRQSAFDACQFVMDETKKTVPIWKNESFVDGAAWVGDPDHPLAG